MAASHVHKYDTGNVSTRPRHESCISMAETLCEGILEKKTATSWKLSRWQPRYFVLTRKSYTDGSNRYCLDYFQDKDTATRSREQLHEIWMSQKRDSADGKKSTHERFIFASVDLCGLRRVKKRYDESGGGRIELVLCWDHDKYHVRTGSASVEAAEMGAEWHAALERVAADEAKVYSASGPKTGPRTPRSDSGKFQYPSGGKRGGGGKQGADLSLNRSGKVAMSSSRGSGGGSRRGGGAAAWPDDIPCIRSMVLTLGKTELQVVSGASAFGSRKNSPEYLGPVRATIVNRRGSAPARLLSGRSLSVGAGGAKRIGAQFRVNLEELPAGLSASKLAQCFLTFTVAEDASANACRPVRVSMQQLSHARKLPNSGKAAAGGDHHSHDDHEHEHHPDSRSLQVRAGSVAVEVRFNDLDFQAWIDGHPHGNDESASGSIGIGSSSKKDKLFSSFAEAEHHHSSLSAGDTALSPVAIASFYILSLAQFWRSPYFPAALRSAAAAAADSAATGLESSAGAAGVGPISANALRSPARWATAVVRGGGSSFAEWTGVSSASSFASLFAPETCLALVLVFSLFVAQHLAGLLRGLSHPRPPSEEDHIDHEHDHEDGHHHGDHEGTLRRAAIFGARQGFCIKVVLTSKAKDVKVETPAPFGTPRQLRQHKMLVDSANGHRRKSSTIIDEDENGKKVRTRATITRHEMECLEELRDRVSDLSFPWSEDDQLMVKYVRARKADMDKVEAMLRKSVQWREEAGADTILRPENRPRCIQEEPGFLVYDYVARLPLHVGRDYNGVPMFVSRFGKTDMAAVCKILGEERAEVAFTWALENLRRICYDAYAESRAEAREQGLTGADAAGCIPQLNVVIDLEGFGMHCLPPLAFLKRMLGIFQDHYPETLHRALIVRAPWAFYTAWKIISPWLDQRILDKINILGSGDITEVLLEWFPADQIPAYIGGAWAEDGDEFCSSKVCPGGRIKDPDNIRVEP